MSGNADERYGDNHRTFLQVLMAYGTLTFRQARPILTAVRNASAGEDAEAHGPVTQDLFENYVALINEQVSALDLQIRSMIPQTSSDASARVYALVNTTSDSPTQLATAYTPDEILFFRRILNAIFETYNDPAQELLAIKPSQAMALTRADPSTQAQNGLTNGDRATQTPASSLTQRDAEKALQSFVDEGWLTRSSRGYHTLSSRALLELKQYLRETYDADLQEGEQSRIKKCWACKDILTIGQRCQDYMCSCRLHDRCVEAFFRSRESQRQQVCPVCKTEWNSEHFVGERSVPEREETGPRRSGAGRRLMAVR